MPVILSQSAIREKTNEFILDLKRTFWRQEIFSLYNLWWVHFLFFIRKCIFWLKTIGHIFVKIGNFKTGSFFYKMAFSVVKLADFDKKWPIFVFCSRNWPFSYKNLSFFYFDHFSPLIFKWKSVIFYFGYFSCFAYFWNMYQKVL